MELLQNWSSMTQHYSARFRTKKPSREYLNKQTDAGAPHRVCCEKDFFLNLIWDANLDRVSTKFSFLSPSFVMSLYSACSSARINFASIQKRKGQGWKITRLLFGLYILGCTIQKRCVIQNSTFCMQLLLYIL